MGKIIKQPAVIILAAGLSERMGESKVNLRFSEEENFLEHIVYVYRRFVVSQMVLVVNESFDSAQFVEDENFKIVINQQPETGRFLSIQMGVQALKNTDVFIQNIDNPFVNVGLLMNLQNWLGEADFAVPVYEGRGGHPVLLSHKIFESIKNDFKDSDRFDEVLQSFNRQDAMVNDPYIRVNINTKEDYLKYFSRL